MSPKDSNLLCNHSAMITFRKLTSHTVLLCNIESMFKFGQLSWYFLKYSCTCCSPGKPKYSIVLNVFLTHTSCFPAFQSFNSCYCFAKNWFSVFFHLFCPKAITHISNTTSKIFLVLGLPSILAPSSWSKSCIELWSTLPLTWAFNHVHLGWKINYESVVS